MLMCVGVVITMVKCMASDLSVCRLGGMRIWTDSHVARRCGGIWRWGWVSVISRSSHCFSPCYHSYDQCFHLFAPGALGGQEAGLTLHTEKHIMRVPRSQRGGEVIEPMISEQWFVKMDVSG